MASSRIENLRVSHRRVAEALVDRQHAPAAAREVANNVTAMARAIDSAGGQIDRETIRAVHRALEEVFDVLDEFESAIARDLGKGKSVGPTRHLRAT